MNTMFCYYVILKRFFFNNIFYKVLREGYENQKLKL